MTGSGRVMVFSKLGIFLNMIKFEHTLFALPFAYVGAFLTEMKIPSTHDLLYITLAMIGARTAAMSLNRIIDRRIDARNPRTAGRALPRGLLSASEVWLYVFLSFCLLLYSSYQLSPLAFRLFPVAVLVLLVYSYTKRITWTCHLLLERLWAWRPWKLDCHCRTLRPGSGTADVGSPFGSPVLILFMLVMTMNLTEGRALFHTGMLRD